MKKQKNDKVNFLPDIKSLLLSSAEAKKAATRHREVLLQSDITQALHYWLQEARNSFQDRGTISNYFAYIKDLLVRGFFSDSQTGKYLSVFELNDFFYIELIERIGGCGDFNINDRRYRIKALLSFTKFLNEQTEGKVKKITAPPIWMSINSTVPKLEDSSVKPQILTEEEFEHLRKKIMRPKQNNHSNLRDCLIIEIMYHTARPLLDILALKKTDINIDNQQIIFLSQDSISILRAPKLNNGLDVYLQILKNRQNDTEMLFCTREGNPIFRTHFYQVLKQASLEADLGFTATFKMIQWSYVADRIKKDKTPQKIMKELKLKRIPKNLESRR
jgi:site-specific recombinase XerC